MSVIAPVRVLTAAERVAGLRRALTAALARVDRDGVVTSCSGLGGDVEAALYWYLMHRTPDALAEVHAATERTILALLGD